MLVGLFLPMKDGKGGKHMHLVLKGLILGLLTASLTTLGDDFVTLVRANDFAIPECYPFVLILVNTLVWGSLGIVSGVLAFRLKKKGAPKLFDRYEDLFWVSCFIVPFLLLYVLLGSVDFHTTVEWTGRTKVYDNHLSILWILGFFGILGGLTITRVTRGASSLVFFLPEIVFIISMLYFCSNLNTQLYQKLVPDFIVTGDRSTNYLFGALFIAGAYACTLVLAAFYKKSSVVKNRSLVKILLFVLPLEALLTFLVWQKTTSAFPMRNGAQESVDGKQRSPVVLIVMDTARADRLSVYGYPKETTPNLKKFAKDALVFENCYAASSWTLPSHASLFTGLYPSEHGARKAEAEQGKADTFPSPLYLEVPSLVELLSRSGYLTGAVVSNSLLHPSFRLDRGFRYYSAKKNIGNLGLSFRPIAHFVCNVTDSFHEILGRYRRASHINAEVFEWLEMFSKDNFFLFVNYMDPHSPYFPPPPFGRVFHQDEGVPVQRLLAILFFKWGLMDVSELARYLSAQYDGEIAYLDKELGRFFGKMKKLGIYESSLIIVTSDHGEFLGEHSLFYHTTYMYEEVIRVPLLIKLPFSSRTGVEARSMQMVDILPTSFDILGLPVPGDIAGAPYGMPKKPVVAEFFGAGPETGTHRVIYDGNYKFMDYDQSKNSEVYDLTKDPSELEDLGNDKKGIASLLSRRLAEWVESHPPRGSRESTAAEALPRELLNDLKALGYIK